MKGSLRKWVVVAALMGCCMTASQAQQGGRFDPEEMRARMMERLREQFEVTDDAEWKIIQAKIEKVNELRRASGGGFGMAGAFAQRRGGGDGGPGRADRGPRRGFGGGEQLAEAEDLRKAIEAKASADEIKAKLAKLREARKANEAKLEAAQEDLRKVLSVRQEAVAVMMGLLK